MLKKTTILILIIVFVALVAAANLLNNKDSDSEDTLRQPYNYKIDTIEASHIFADGFHIYRGYISLPTPCHEIIHTVTIAESFPEQVMIDFVVGDASDFCAQVITKTSFEVSFQASEKASVRAKLNSKSVKFNVTENNTPKSSEGVNNKTTKTDTQTATSSSNN